MLLCLRHCGHQQYCSSKYKATTRKKEHLICLNFYICKHLHFGHITINDMAQKDPVCNMMVDEKNAQHISEEMARKSTYVLHNVKISLIRTQANMDTNRC